MTESIVFTVFAICFMLPVGLIAAWLLEDDDCPPSDGEDE